MKIELTTEQLEGIAYFATAEALSQGYDLTNENEVRSFLRHVEGSARQYFMKQNVWPFFQLRADFVTRSTLNVATLVCYHGSEHTLQTWDITIPGASNDSK